MTNKHDALVSSVLYDLNELTDLADVDDFVSLYFEHSMFGPDED